MNKTRKQPAILGFANSHLSPLLFSLQAVALSVSQLPIVPSLVQHEMVSEKLIEPFRRLCECC